MLLVMLSGVEKTNLINCVLYAKNSNIELNVFIVVPLR